jgi:pilus assembly protein CpaC
MKSNRLWTIGLATLALTLPLCLAAQNTAESAAAAAQSATAATSANTAAPANAANSVANGTTAATSSPAPAASSGGYQRVAPYQGTRQAQDAASTAVPAGTQMASLNPSTDEAGQTLHVIVGRSMFIDTPDRLRRVYISNPTVVDSITPTPRELVITAKTAGESSLVLWNESGKSSVYTVSADVDVTGLREALSQALPGDRIKVDSQQGKVFISGVVGSDAEADAAAKLAGNYSPTVMNSLVVDPRHRPQIQLKVRFAELDRSKLDAFGINMIGLNSKNIGYGSTEQFSPPVFQGGGTSESVLVSDFLNLFYFNSQAGVGVTVKDLATKGILEILAEPTLTTLDGQPAKFLAGGEFPFPIVQPGSAGGTATVTIQFKEYGVKLDFTPYVNPDGTIRLKVTPEVSSLDYTNVVVISGYQIPSISTRRAETQVELKNGQSFGISGILDHRTTDSLSKVPGIGDIPILGQLFRSKNLNHSTMELIVVVTPTVVDPLNNDIPVPNDPSWVTKHPGDLGDFNKNLPRSYGKGTQP